LSVAWFLARARESAGFDT